MANTRHYPPAYYRYRKEHPVISVVLTKELKQLLDRERKKEKQSYADLIKQFIGKGCDMLKARQEGYGKGYKDGHLEGTLGGNKEGYERGRTFELGVCSKCGKTLSWNLDGSKDIELLTKAVNDARYIHSGCG